MKIKAILTIVAITFVVRWIYGYLTAGSPTAAGTAGSNTGPLSSVLPAA